MKVSDFLKICGFLNPVYKFGPLAFQDIYLEVSKDVID